MEIVAFPHKSIPSFASSRKCIRTMRVTIEGGGSGPPEFILSLKVTKKDQQALQLKRKSYFTMETKTGCRRHIVNKNLCSDVKRVVEVRRHERRRLNFLRGVADTFLEDGVNKQH